MKLRNQSMTALPDQNQDGASEEIYLVKSSISQFHPSPRRNSWSPGSCKKAHAINSATQTRPIKCSDTEITKCSLIKLWRMIPNLTVILLSKWLPLLRTVSQPFHSKSLTNQACTSDTVTGCSGSTKALKTINFSWTILNLKFRLKLLVAIKEYRLRLLITQIIS